MLVIPPQAPLDYPMVNVTSLKRTTKVLHRKLRQVPDGPRKGKKNLPIPTVIQSKMEKHGYKKPKVIGAGDTTCILTNVKGFRDVLQSVLSFYGLVHEFHELDPQFHEDLPNLKVSLDNLLSGSDSESRSILRSCLLTRVQQRDRVRKAVHGGAVCSPLECDLLECTWCLETWDC